MAPAHSKTCTFTFKNGRLSVPEKDRQFVVRHQIHVENMNIEGDLDRSDATNSSPVRLTALIRLLDRFRVTFDRLILWNIVLALDSFDVPTADDVLIIFHEVRIAASDLQPPHLKSFFAGIVSRPISGTVLLKLSLAADGMNRFIFNLLELVEADDLSKEKMEDLDARLSGMSAEDLKNLDISLLVLRHRDDDIARQYWGFRDQGFSEQAAQSRMYSVYIHGKSRDFGPRLQPDRFGRRFPRQLMSLIRQQSGEVIPEQLPVEIFSVKKMAYFERKVIAEKLG